MVKRFRGEKKMMTKRRISKLVHDGEYVAEVEVELICTELAPPLRTQTLF
jgi:hypothetical protein